MGFLRRMGIIDSGDISADAPFRRGALVFVRKHFDLIAFIRHICSLRPSAVGSPDCPLWSTWQVCHAGIFGCPFGDRPIFRTGSLFSWHQRQESRARIGLHIRRSGHDVLGLQGEEMSVVPNLVRAT